MWWANLGQCLVNVWPMLGKQCCNGSMFGQFWVNVWPKRHELGQCWANVEPMLGQCWANVGLMSANVGSMLGQCWDNVGPMLGQCWANVGLMLANVGSMLGQWGMNWVNVEPMLGQQGMLFGNISCLWTYCYTTSQCMSVYNASVSTPTGTRLHVRDGTNNKSHFALSSGAAPCETSTICSVMINLVSFLSSRVMTWVPGIMYPVWKLSTPVFRSSTPTHRSAWQCLNRYN